LNKGSKRVNRFEMTDIVPLISHAWLESFAKTSSSKKAIAQRGWGPLNFALLDHPDVRKTNAGDGINTSLTSTTSEYDIDIVSSLNFSTGFSSNMMEKIITEQMKDKSRIESL
jgi:hypothetical protein